MIQIYPCLGCPIHEKVKLSVHLKRSDTCKDYYFQLFEEESIENVLCLGKPLLKIQFWLCQDLED